MKIYIKVLACQKTLCFRVGEQRRIESVKRQLNNRLPSPRNVFRLYLCVSGDLEPLNDAETLSENGVRDGDSVYVGTKLTVNVNVIGGQSGVVMSVNTAHSIAETKATIQKRIGIHPDQQRLVLGHGEVVRDGANVRDYELRNGDTLFVIRRKCQYTITIQEYQNRGLPNAHLLLVRSDYTIREVKEHIAEITKTPPDLHSLQFKHRKLHDNKTLQFYSIGPRSELLVHTCSQIFIRTLAGNTLTLRVPESDSVQSLKSMIEEKEGVPVHLQKLYFNGQQVQQGTLCELGIVNGATLELSLCLSGGGIMEVYIKTMEGVTLRVAIEADNTVLELKQKIQEQKDYPIEWQKLIFCGKELDNGQTLAGYNIQSATTLHLVVRQPVGEPTISVRIITPSDGELLFQKKINGTTIESVAEFIEEKEGIPRSCQRLYHKGRLIDHKKLLRDFENSSNLINPMKQEVCMYLEIKGEVEVLIKVLSRRNANIFSVRVDRHMKVFGLKKIIQHREKIPVYYQTLIFNGVKLLDDNSLEEGKESVQNHSVIHLWHERLYRDQTLNITVQIPTNSLYCQDLSVSAKISDVKGRCGTLVGDSLLHHYSLYYGSIILELDKCLHEYRITEGSTLQLVKQDEFPIFINLAGSTETFVNAKKTDRVKDIKERLCTNKITAMNKHGLYLSGVILSETKTLEEYKISAACQLSCVSSVEIPVSVRTRLATVTVGVHPTQPLQIIMDMIASAPGICIEPCNQRLLLYSRVLSRDEDATKSIRELGIRAGNTLNLVILPEELDLYISLPRGSTLTLICLLDWTIRDVKAAIEKSENLPVASQILPFESDEKSLREYRLQPGTHLDLVHQPVPHMRALDEQERDLMHRQNQQLQQRLEGTIEGSNYQISMLKEEVAHSQKKISQLEEENQKMTQGLRGLENEVVERKEELGNLKKKLMNTAKLRRTSNQSTLSDIAEETDVGNDTSIDDDDGPAATSSSVLPEYYEKMRTVTYRGEEENWEWEERGIKLAFPQHHEKREIQIAISLDNDSTEDEIDVYGDYDHAKFVSAVYSIRVSSPLPVPVTVDIQHCVRITDTAAANSLCFVRASSTDEFFKPIKGGEFDINTRYGRIQLSQFSRLSIGELFGRQSNAIYLARVFTKDGRVPNKRDFLLAITKDLKDHNAQVRTELGNKWDDPEAEAEIKFGAEISMTSNTEQDDIHWLVTEVVENATIKKKSVEKYRPGKRIPHLTFKATWTASGPPVSETLPLVLTGALSPDDNAVLLRVDCTPSKSISVGSTISSPRSSINSQPFEKIVIPSDCPIFEERVNLDKFICIIFLNEDGRQEQLRLKDQLGDPQWKYLAAKLGFTPSQISTFAERQDCRSAMISRWIQRDGECTWRRLIEKMDEAGLRVLALDLRDALIHIIQDH